MDKDPENATPEIFKQVEVKQAQDFASTINYQGGFFSNDTTHHDHHDDYVHKNELPKDFGKMPKDYNFQTRKFNWKEYSSDYILRTDAVWEKEQLKDYARNFLKVFYYSKPGRRYEWIEPQDWYTVFFEGWTFSDDYITWDGYTPTGRTNSFQVGTGPKQRIVTTIQSGAVMQDYYYLCALRFERWHRCDLAYYDKRDQYDTVMDQSKYKQYPCYRHFYEAQYACTDDLFDFLLELSYAKKANDTFEQDWANTEIQSFPTVYDTPDAQNRKTYTY